MLRSIATVSISGTLPEKLSAIAEAGYQGVEIFENDLLYYTGSPGDIRQMAADLGLQITLFQPFRDFEGASRAQFAANLERARRKFELMHQLGCNTLLLCSSVSPDTSPDIELQISDLRALAELAERENIKVGYEALAWGTEVNRWQQAWRRVKAVDSPAMGIVLDSFHVLALGTMINYLDRTVLGIAAPALTHELGINAAIMGIVFSAFAWTYALAQIPGGLFLDRFGNKITYFLSLTLWSLFTLFHGMAVGIKSLLLCRFGLGVSEAPCFPVNSRVVSAWFPQQERAKATAVYTVGEYLGLACFSPLLFWIMGSFGWRALFISVGVVGILFAFAWWRLYREPHEDARLSQQEHDYIAAGGGIHTATAQNTQFSWPLVRQLLSKRQIVGASIGQFAGNTVLVFFLTWFPTWLATERHMPWLKVGFFAILPFLAAAGGVMFGGWVSDKLLKVTHSANLSRKLPIIVGLLMASCIILANWLHSDTAVILVMSFAFFGQGMVGLGWTLISDMAPRGLGGLTAGLFNFCANLAGILTPLVIGFIVAFFGNFFYALIYIGGATLLGVVAYVFILGDVKRIELRVPQD